MCSVCLQTPCHSRCPNAPEPEPIATCISCYKSLYEGDEYLDLPEGPICEGCVRDMNGIEILEYLGEELCVAHKGDF